MDGLDIGAMLTRLLPIFDYYITFFSKLLTNFAASLGMDIDPTPEEPDAEQGEAVQ